MNNDSTQRLSPQGDNGEEKVGGLLAAASDFARSVLEAIQALAGTTSCKGVQLTNEARAEPNLFELCLARRKKTIVKLQG